MSFSFRSISRLQKINGMTRVRSAIRCYYLYDIIESKIYCYRRNYMYAVGGNVILRGRKKKQKEKNHENSSSFAQFFFLLLFYYSLFLIRQSFAASIIVSQCCRSIIRLEHTTRYPRILIFTYFCLVNAKCSF